jgi:hypothetical protein
MRDSGPSAATVREVDVPLEKMSHLVLIGGIGHRRDVESLAAQSRREAPCRVEHEGTSTTHTGGEVPPHTAEYDDHATGHVLAPMVANSFHNGDGAAVTHGKPFPGRTSDERIA